MFCTRQPSVRERNGHRIEDAVERVLELPVPKRERHLFALLVPRREIRIRHHLLHQLRLGHHRFLALHLLFDHLSAAVS